MRLINRDNRIFRFIVTFFFVMTLFIPSIKFVVFSGVVNFLIMVVLICLMIMSVINNRNVSKNNFIVGVLYSGLIILILLSGLSTSAIIDPKTISKFIFILLLLLSVVMLFEYIDIRIFVSLTIFLSTTLVVLNKLGIVQVSGSGELSYLILSMQVSLGVSALVARSFFSTRHKPLYLALLFFNLYGVLTLAGRSSIAGVALILTICLILYSIMNFKDKKIKIIFFWSSLVVLSSYILNYLLDNVFNAYFLHKVEMLLSGQGDIRFSTYLKAIDIIANNPLGIGLNGYEYELGFYPHNILLEIGLNIGVLGVFLFSVLLFLFVFSFYQKIKKSKMIITNELSLFLMSISLLITWSTSNSLSSSYSLFMCLILSTCFSLRRKRSLKIKRINND
jgi:O-antigen ligase